MGVSNVLKNIFMETYLGCTSFDIYVSGRRWWTWRHVAQIPFQERTCVPDSRRDVRWPPFIISHFKDCPSCRDPCHQGWALPEGPTLTDWLRKMALSLLRIARKAILSAQRPVGGMRVTSACTSARPLPGPDPFSCPPAPQLSCTRAVPGNTLHMKLQEADCHLQQFASSEVKHGSAIHNTTRPIGKYCLCIQPPAIHFAFLHLGCDQRGVIICTDSLLTRPSVYD